MQLKMTTVPPVSVSRQTFLHFPSRSRKIMKLGSLCSRGRHSATAADQLLKCSSRLPTSSFQRSYSTHYYPEQFANKTLKLNPVFDNKKDDIQHSQKLLVKANSTGAPLDESASVSSKSFWESTKNNIDVLYRFSRPHSFKGTIMGVACMSFLAIDKLSDISPSFMLGVLKALVVALCMNIYLAGLNQVTDIELDKINKPDLPMASGELSYENGVLIVAFCAILGFCLAWSTASWPLIWAALISFIMGTAYSIPLPLLRWKNSGLLATTAIILYRAVIIQVPYYMHVQTQVLQRPFVLSKTLIFTTAFVSLFSFVSAQFKDIPDMEGDKSFGIQTYTVRLGRERVFWFCVSLLEIGYGSAICVGALFLNPRSKVITILGHACAAWLLWNRANAIDLKNNAATLGFYMFIWKLLCAEYLLFPLMR